MNLDITLQEYLGTAPEGPQGRLGKAPKGPEGGREGGCEGEVEHVGDREHDSEEEHECVCEGESFLRIQGAGGWRTNGNQCCSVF